MVSMGKVLNSTVRIPYTLVKHSTVLIAMRRGISNQIDRKKEREREIHTHTHREREREITWDRALHIQIDTDIHLHNCVPVKLYFRRASHVLWTCAWVFSYGVCVREGKEKFWLMNVCGNIICVCMYVSERDRETERCILMVRVCVCVERESQRQKERVVCEVWSVRVG